MLKTCFQMAALLGFLVSAFVLQAQDTAPIKFSETTHQFGDIPRGIPVIHTFSFTNTSQQEIKLTNVRASCGCTTPNWTRDAVAPGATGEIKVQFNAAAMGNFTKTVTVQYEGGERPVVLYIKGNVVADAASEDAAYSSRMGDLGFDRTAHALGTLDSDKKQTVTFKVKNLGKAPITFGEDIAAEMMLSVVPGQKTLAPGEKTEINVTLDGAKFIGTGPFVQNIRIPTNQAQNPELSLTVTGTLNKVFSAEELALMPSLQFERTSYDAGTVIEGEKVDFSFAFTNTGKSELVIESVKASCGCTASSPRDKVIPPGGTSEIVASFDSRGREGNQNKSITVRSNDPAQPTVILRLLVEVERDPFHVGSSSPAAGGR